MNTNFDEIIEKYKNMPQVKSVAIGGSTSAKTFDNISDIDVYVFVEKDIPVSDREGLIQKYSDKYEVGEEYFGSGDEFLLKEDNIVMDMMYWNIIWFEDIINNVWIKHISSNGYTTAFLYTLSNFQIIYDTNDWLSNLQKSIKTEYPKELKENIIHRNLMLISEKPFASYYEQIEKGINRNDIASINHRIAAFLASYFDIIFAINELLHPGEKRLVQYAKNNCKILPKNFEENINKLLAQPNSNTLNILDSIIENLKEILI